MHWKTKSTETIFKSGLVTIKKDVCELPDGRIMPAYYSFNFPDWVNIVALTPEKKFVMVEQYRHATEKTHWEVPGGAINRGEEPLMGAQRELLEETGYATKNWQLIAQTHPNPALQQNFTFTYLALDCEKVGPQQLDPFEDIRVEEVSAPQVEQWLHHGKIDHTIVVASLFHAFNFLRTTKSL